MSHSTSRVTDSQGFDDIGSNVTPLSSVDWEESFRKETDTVMAVYGSSSTHSSVSESSSGVDYLRTGSPRSFNAAFAKEIGSHLLEDNGERGDQAESEGLIQLVDDDRRVFDNSVHNDDVSFRASTQGTQRPTFFPKIESAMHHRRLFNTLYNLDLALPDEADDQYLSSGESSPGDRAASEAWGNDGSDLDANEDYERQRSLTSVARYRETVILSSSTGVVILTLGFCIALYLGFWAK